jgi:two-component system OmpR family sensor kinase
LSGASHGPYPVDGPPAGRPADGRRPLHSIRWRLIAALAGVSLFAVVVVGVIFYLFLAGYVVDREQEKLLSQGLATAEQIQNLGDLLPSGTVKANAAALLLRTGIRGLPAGAGMVLFRADQAVAKAGILPVRAQNLDRLRVAAAQASTRGPVSGRAESVLGTNLRGVDLLYAAVPVTLNDGTQGLLVVTLPRSDALAAGSGLRRVLLLAAIIAVVVAVAVGWGLASWLARPLRRLSAAARELAAGRFDTPVTGSYPGEVQELADSLETTRAEVQRSQDSLRGFVASAAHELRTPMTSIQGFSQALLDGTADDPEQRQMAAAAIVRESGRLQRTLDALLTLSRYDSREFHPTMAPVVVDRLVRDEVEALAQAGWTSAARIEVKGEAGVEAITDADMLRQVVGNLLRNAVQYGGEDPIDVWVRTEAGRSSQGRVMVDVINGGQPLTAEERQRIFERFFRGRSAAATQGLGLGLALCREICEVLGGRIEVVGDGPATHFRVTIPKSAWGRVLP